MRTFLLLLTFLTTLSLAGCGDRSKPATNGAGKTTSDQSKQALQRAVAALKNGDHRRAETELRPVLVAHPKHAEGLFILGQAQAAQGEFAEAIRTLDSIDDGPSQLAVLGQSADWLIRLRRYSEAETRLRKIIDLNPDIAQAHRRLAQLLNNQGRRSQAVSPMRALARLGVATETELLGMTTFSDPFIHQPIHRIAPEVEPNALCMARIRLYENNTVEAWKLAEAAGSNDPRSTATAAFMGRLIVARQDNDAFTQWLASRPDEIESEPEYWSALGTWYQHQDEHDVAIRCFLEAVKRDDTDRFSYLGLARSLEVKGESEPARRAMERFELLDKVGFIVTEEELTPQQKRTLPSLLNQLRRPNEARNWQADFDMTTGRPIDRASEPVSLDWITCGVESSAWPLPDLGTSQATTQRPVVTSDGQGSMILKDVAASTNLQMQYLPGPPGTSLDLLLMHQTVGGGVSALDYDLDGWGDVYFTQSAGTPFQYDAAEPNHLFRNLSGKRFLPVTDQAAVGDTGYGQGVTACDINQDGFADLIVANIGTNALLINNGDGTFHKAAYGDPSNLWTTSIACGDITGDQLPDIVEVNYIDDDTVLAARCSVSQSIGRCNPQRFRPAIDRMLRERPDGTLEPLLLELPAGYGFAAIIANFDDKFGNDVFITNDTSANHFWQSQPDPDAQDAFQLVERARLLGCGVGVSGNPESCMGIATGDFDRNGRMDLHVTNYHDESSDMYLQHASGIFSNHAIRFGLEEATHPMVGWGTQAADLDCDGWLDLVAVNGHLYSDFTDGTPYRMPPQLFRGGENGFTDQTDDLKSEPFWQQPALGRTLATADWNRDGRVDLIAYNIDTPAALLENQTAVGNWLQLELIGTASERTAVGGKITIVCEQETWTTWLTGGDGFQCNNESVAHFGIGAKQTIDTVQIAWPAGTTSTYYNVTANRRYLAIEGEDQLFER